MLVGYFIDKRYEHVFQDESQWTYQLTLLLVKLLDAYETIGRIYKIRSSETDNISQYNKNSLSVSLATILCTSCSYNL